MQRGARGTALPLLQPGSRGRRRSRRRAGSRPIVHLRAVGPDSDEAWRRGRAIRAVSPGAFEMTSSRPYLLRAMYEWIADNDLTPQIVVDAQQEQVRVPAAGVREGKIVLNISPSAVRGLSLGNEWVEFGARFDGIPFEVAVPVHAVLAIMARENGIGMSFPDSDGDRPPPKPGPPPKPRSRPSLKVVK